MRKSAPPAPVPLSEVIGANTRAIREAEGLRQQDVAEALQRLGLGWDRSAVAALELGRRRVGAGELLLLPLALSLAAGRAFSLADLLRHTGLVELPGGNARPGDDVLAMIDGSLADELLAEGKGSARSEEESIAARYGLDLEGVRASARALFAGRTFAEARAAETVELARRHPAMEPQERRTRIGHITRAMRQALESDVAPIGVERREVIFTGDPERAPQTPDAAAASAADKPARKRARARTSRGAHGDSA